MTEELKIQIEEYRKAIGQQKQAIKEAFPAPTTEELRRATMLSIPVREQREGVRVKATEEVGKGETAFETEVSKYYPEYSMPSYKKSALAEAKQTIQTRADSAKQRLESAKERLEELKRRSDARSEDIRYEEQKRDEAQAEYDVYSGALAGDEDELIKGSFTGYLPELASYKQQEVESSYRRSEYKRKEIEKYKAQGYTPIYEGGELTGFTKTVEGTVSQEMAKTIEKEVPQEIVQGIQQGKYTIKQLMNKGYSSDEISQIASAISKAQRDLEIKYQQIGYKPIVDLKTGEVKGYEDLKRKASIPIENIPKLPLSQLKEMQDATLKLQQQGLIHIPAFSEIYAQKVKEEIASKLFPRFEPPKAESVKLDFFRTLITPTYVKENGMARSLPFGLEMREGQKFIIQNGKYVPIQTKTFKEILDPFLIKEIQAISPDKLLQKVPVQPGTVAAFLKEKGLEKVAYSPTEDIAFFAFMPIITKPALGTGRIVTVEPPPKLKLRAIDIVKEMKDTEAGLFRLGIERPPRYAQVTTELEAMFKMSPKKVQISPRQVFYVYTPGLEPPKIPQMKLLGGEPLRASIITRKGMIEGEAGFVLMREDAKTGKLLQVYGGQTELTLKNFNQLSPIQKMELQKMAATKARLPTVPMEQVPNILGKDYKISSGILEVEEIGKVKLFPDKFELQYKLNNIPKKITRTEQVTLVKQLMENPEGIRLYQTITGLKDVTMPIPRAIGEVQMIKGVSVALPYTPEEEAIKQIFRVTKPLTKPSTILKSTIRPETEKAIATLAQIKEIAPKFLPRARTAAIHLEEPFTLKKYPAIVGGTKVSEYAGRGLLAGYEISAGLVPSDVGLRGVQKEGLKVSPALIPITTVETISQLKEQLKTQQQLKEQLKNQFKEQLKLRPDLRESLKGRLDHQLKQIYNLEQQLKQQLKIEQRLKVELKIPPVITKIPTEIKIKVPPPHFLITPKPPKVPKEIRPKRLPKKAYIPLVKIKGKWKIVGRPMAREAAIKRGEFVTVRKAAATFRIVPAKEFIPRHNPNYAPSPAVFRPYKIVKGVRVPLKDMWIQRRAKRIMTPEEVREITMVGIAARRKKLYTQKGSSSILSPTFPKGKAGMKIL